MSGTGRNPKAPWPLNELEAGCLHHLSQRSEVRLPPPGPPDRIEHRDGAAAKEQRIRQIDRVADDQRSRADAPHSLERPVRIAQVQEEASEVDEVELPHVVWSKVVNAQFPALDGGPKGAPRDLESDPAPRPSGQRRRRLRSAVRRPLPAMRVVDVDRQDLLG